MEFAIEFQSTLRAQKRGVNFTSSSPNQSVPLAWKNRFGYVYFDVLKIKRIVADGLNEKGLALGLLWMPDSQYQEIKNNDEKKVLDVTDFGAWALGSFESVKEIKQALTNIKIWSPFIKQLGMAPLVHITVTDRFGESIVIEFLNKKMVIKDNPFALLTNAPKFSWQIANLRNYIHLSPNNTNKLSSKNHEIFNAGLGIGMRGLPGDWTPPSRFVRTFAMLHTVEKTQSSEDAVNLAAHILNALDIPKGVVRSSGPNGSSLNNYTQWVTIRDLSRLEYYYRSYEDLTLRKIDLKKIDFDKVKNDTFITVKEGAMSVKDMTNLFGQ